jgi:broad specificity phosphatase PhoE
MKEQTIVLARHGQSNFNIYEKIQDPFTPYLTEIGHKQAQATAKEIEKSGIIFDLIICSDATRNKETLAEIYPNYKNMNNVEIDSRLQERYHRDLIGKTKKDIETEIGQKFDERLSWELYFEGTDKSMLTSRNYTNDEPIDSIKRRIEALITEIKDKSKILLIGSAIINHYILEFLQNKTIGVNRPQFPEGNTLDFQKNNELRIITIDGNAKMTRYTPIIY